MLRACHAAGRRRGGADALRAHRRGGRDVRARRRALPRRALPTRGSGDADDTLRTSPSRAALDGIRRHAPVIQEADMTGLTTPAPLDEESRAGMSVTTPDLVAGPNPGLGTWPARRARISPDARRSPTRIARSPTRSSPSAPRATRAPCAGSASARATGSRTWASTPSRCSRRSSPRGCSARSPCR